MTREEAIEVLNGILKLNYREWWDYKCDEAVEMAIEALQTDAVHDGCFECRYLYNSADEYPCKSCKYNYLDMWEQKPNDFVSVVRCKDCRYQEHCHETVAHTKDHDGFREHWSEPIEWCSRGERREE